MRNGGASTDAIRPARQPAAGASARQRRFARAPKIAVGIGFGWFAALADFCAIVLAAAASNVIYGMASFGLMPKAEPITTVGVVIALFVLFSNIQRNEYSIRRFETFHGHVGRCASVWNLAFFCVFAIGFATKTTDVFSRGAVAVFYIIGLATLGGMRVVLVRIAEALKQAGALARRRLVVVGFEEQLSAFVRRYDLSQTGMEVAAAIILRDSEGCLEDDLALAAATIRVRRPDDIFIVVPWSQARTIDACVDAFLRMPAEIHLGPESILDRFAEAEVSQLGPINSLNLTRRPLSLLQRLEKRVFDIVIASAALALLSPLFAVVALLIRLDGPGPIFFLQRRYGFNQEPFRIVKFRTMTAMEDDARLIAATRFDPRVTRIGAFLRRTSIDELPQLLNVLAGDMSLVGPRPHALAHDQKYERRIAQYARRHNVSPGITGWAQVCGLRGEITTEEKMRLRVEHDLYYVDNWSLWLDIKIIAMTMFSPKTHSDVY